MYYNVVQLFPRFNDEGPTSKAKNSEEASETYNMNHKRRGVAIIFNHIHFRKMAVRNGGEYDSKNLAETLLEIGFDVRVYIDPSLAEIFTALNTSKYTVFNIPRKIPKNSLPSCLSFSTCLLIQTYSSVFPTNKLKFGQVLTTLFNSM